MQQKHETCLFKFYSKKNMFGIIRLLIYYFLFFSTYTKKYKYLPNSNCRGASYLSVLFTRCGISWDVETEKDEHKMAESAYINGASS